MTRFPALRLFAGTLILLASTLSGFAHRAPDAGLERFLAAGFALSDLCADSHPGGDLHDRGPCEACRLVGAAVMAGAPEVPARPLTLAQVLPTPRQAPPHILSCRVPGGGSRAPPAA